MHLICNANWHHIIVFWTLRTFQLWSIQARHGNTVLYFKLLKQLNVVVWAWAEVVLIGLRKGASNVQGLRMGGEGYLWEGTQQTIKYLPSNAP